MDSAIPVEIKAWVPDGKGGRTLMRLRGTLREMSIHNELGAIHYGGGWIAGVLPHDEDVVTGQLFTLTGRVRPWKYDRHRVPKN